MHIVGVHGIFQADTNAIQLSADWRGTVAASLTRHAGPAAPVPALTMPYYGNLFRKTKRWQLSGPDTGPGLAGIDDEEEEFLVEALQAYAPDAVVPDAAPATLGDLPKISPRLSKWMAGLDGAAGRHVGEAVIGRLREVYGYLNDTTAAEQVRKMILDALTTSGATLLIAHSLGSVIAYDMFQRGRIPAPKQNGGVRQLITLGSPLSWLPIQRHLGVAAELALPAGVAWVNVFDPNDFVTGGQGLSDKAAGVRDITVDNGKTPHAAVNYLSQEAVAQTVCACQAKLQDV